MNKVICRMALVLAVASLTGCGLKGPLYFPPQEQPKKQTSASDYKPTRADAQKQTTTTDPTQTSTSSETTESGTTSAQ
ncbi:MULTISPECIES: LPS translocon maturation chaperone LptM [unclassified Erwinia]|uniref:LPS translocon maturation chaperone LptM n=1 Tax=Erwinia TaxID=551 RepID=UPI00093D344B|nr:lipoprotein [Erwinia sp. ErVv1]